MVEWTSADTEVHFVFTNDCMCLIFSKNELLSKNIFNLDCNDAIFEPRKNV